MEFTGKYEVRVVGDEQWECKLDYRPTPRAKVATATVLVGVHDVTVTDLGRPYKVTKAEQDRVYDIMGCARRRVRNFIFNGR